VQSSLLAVFLTLQVRGNDLLLVCGTSLNVLGSKFSVRVVCDTSLNVLGVNFQFGL
jgi:hypothetical protein